MVVQQEVNCSYAWDLEAINTIASILMWTQELYDAINRQEASQPVPLVVVADVETHIAVAGLVSALLNEVSTYYAFGSSTSSYPSSDDISERRANGWAKFIECNGILRVIRRLLSWVFPRSSRGW